MYFYGVFCLFVDIFSQLIPQGISPSSGFSNRTRSNPCQVGNEILKKCKAKPHIKLKFIVTRVIVCWHCDSIATHSIADWSSIKENNPLAKFSTSEWQRVPADLAIIALERWEVLYFNKKYLRKHFSSLCISAWAIEAELLWKLEDSVNFIWNHTRLLYNKPKFPFKYVHNYLLTLTFQINP